MFDIVKPTRDGNNTLPGVDKSKSLRKITILSFSSSTFCMVFFFANVVISYIQHIHLLEGNVKFVTIQVKAIEKVLSFCSDLTFYDHMKLKPRWS